MNDYKRKTREMPQYVKDKISATLTGRKLSDETKKKISDGQKEAWAKTPKKTDWNEPLNTPTENDKNKKETL